MTMPPIPLTPDGSGVRLARMRIENTPGAGPAYWLALSAASVFGADCGDCASHLLGLGHVRGLPVLAALFALTLVAERRVPGWTQAPTVAFYWVAIVLLRTGATNLGDLMTHDLRLGYVRMAAILALATAACAAVAAGRDHGTRPPPRIDALYWLTMGLAGTFGTVAGDAVSRMAGHDPGTATMLLLPLLLGAFALHGAAGGVVRYWALVAVIRTIGTTFGDWSADATTLPVGTATSGLTLLAMVAASTSRSRTRAAA